MGLLDEIAKGGNSAPATFYMKGKQEKRAARLDDLRTSLAERKLTEFDKESDLRDLQRDEKERKLQPEYIAGQEKAASEKAGLEKDKLKGLISKNKVATEKIQAEVDKYNTEEELRVQEEKDSQTLNMMDGAVNQYKGDPAGLRKYMEDNYDKLLELGSDAADEGLKRMMEMSPEQLAQAMPQILEMSPVTIEMRREAWESKNIKGKKGSSEFERLDAIDNRTPGQEQRWLLLSGQVGRKPTEGTDKRHDDRIEMSKRSLELRKEGLDEKKATTQATKEKGLRKEAGDGLEHFNKMETAITGALAAIDSGDNGLADMLLSTQLPQILDSKVRAFAMYKEADKGFGNVAERLMRGVGRFVTGTRTDAERKEIADTLRDFQKNYVKPGADFVKKRYRGLASDSEVDKYRVIPPSSKEEIRDDKSLDMARKIELIKYYYPEEFQ